MPIVLNIFGKYYPIVLNKMHVHRSGIYFFTSF